MQRGILATIVALPEARDEHPHLVGTLEEGNEARLDDIQRFCGNGTHQFHAEHVLAEHSHTSPIVAIRSGPL